MDSLAMGQLVLPALEKMTTRIPQVRCVVLCTPDGFNLCSIGLEEAQVGKMAALSSSLLSVGAATMNSLASDEESMPPLEVMTLEADGLHIVSTKIAYADGHLVLMVASRAPLGVVLMGAKSAANDVRGLL
jgi:predicted regulator of Ras-like GTPase activity (Roadblock/LC7/MglB family)